MKKFKWILLLLIAYHSSCNNKQEYRRSKIVYIKNGYKYVIPYLLKSNDTLYDGIAEYYYPSGIKSDQIEYVQNLKNGWHIHYDSSGTIRNKIMYKSGLANGLGFFYNSAGNIEVENFYLNDKLLFAKWFYSEGKIKAYVAMNDTVPFYAVDFDLAGNKKSEKGYAFSLSESCFYPKLDSVKVGQEFRAIIPVAAIPGYSVKIEIVKFDSLNVMIAESEVAIRSEYIATYTTRFEKLGKYRIGVAGELRDEKGNKLRNDTLLVNINVVD